MKKISFNTAKVNKLAFWINERERVRMAKEAGKPKPWTKDPMLMNYRFCNVHREDDKVTRWIAKHWRDPNKKDVNLWHAMIVARFINWPDTLEAIGYPEPWSTKRNQVCLKIKQRKRHGYKVFTGAYIVSTNGAPMDKVDFVIDLFDIAWQAGWGKFETLDDAWTHLKNMKGLGTFMAAQVVADLKYTPMLSNAKDWWDWCAPGPGSLKGLSLVMGGDGSFKSSQEFRKPEVFIECLTNLRKTLEPKLPGSDKIHLQDLQNCLCEFSKYIRGSSRSRYEGA